MFTGKILINRTSKTHHETLQVVFNDFNKSYDELLELNKNLSIHQIHLRHLSIDHAFKSTIHVVLF